MSTMTEERWAALREQFILAGRPSAFEEIEKHLLFTNQERSTALDQLKEKMGQIETLQAQVADLQATVAELTTKLGALPAPATPPVTP